MSIFRSTASLLMLGGSLAASSAALAQAPGELQGGETASVGTDENIIIVTAQNRAQNVQDVPIAMNVIDSDAIRAAGVTDFTSIERIAPVVQITNETTNTRVALRGVGTNASDETQDQSIAVNIDGEYLNRPTVLNAAIFDLDRIEVLRGPQGTLYGRNATGGAINFITRKPGRDFAVNASASYGNYNHVLLEGGVDVPLGDIGGLRFSGIYSDRKGYDYHPNLDRRSNDDHTIGGRASVRLRPLAGLTLDAAIERVDVDVSVPVYAWLDINTPGNAPGAGCGGVPGWAEVAPLTPGTQCVPQNTNYLSQIDRHEHDAPLSGLGVNRIKSTAARGRMAYDFGPAILTYTGGYRTTSQTGRSPLTPNFAFLNFVGDTKTNSHELRLNGENDSGFAWQLGGFYFGERLKVERGVFAPFIGAGGGYATYFRRPFVKTDSWSGFGQVDVPLFAQVTAVAGARYTDDKRSGLYENLGGQPGTGPVLITTPATPAQTQHLSTGGNKFTWLLGLNYEPSTRTLIYGKVATGFKAGGFDALGTYKPETNTAYEAGVKLNFGAAGRNRLNLAGYYYDYKDLQVSVVVDPTQGQRVFNAGKATIWGAELETALKVFDNGTFSASINYLNAKYDSLFASTLVFCVACADNSVGDLDTNPATVTPPSFAGNRPPQAPRWTLTAGYDHVFELGASGSITASAFTRFKSAYYLDIFNFRDSRQKPYTQTDLSLEYRPESKKWSVQGFVRNLEDTRQLVFAGFQSIGPFDVYNWQFGAPRTYGVRLAIDY